MLYEVITLRELRGRAVGVVTGGVALSLLLLFLLPVPSWTNAEGVVWIGEDSLVRAGASGFIDEIVGVPGQVVKKGDVLMRCSNAELSAQRDVVITSYSIHYTKLYEAEPVRSGRR